MQQFYLPIVACGGGSYHEHNSEAIELSQMRLLRPMHFLELRCFSLSNLYFGFDALGTDFWSVDHLGGFRDVSRCDAQNSRGLIVVAKAGEQYVTRISRPQI